MQKTELLAPAGTYESFLGAIHAGADAVYLAGQKFGARAYAGNFSTEELCRAIRYAHLSERKVYLTLNTLVKEDEFAELYEYLHPFYEEGLDGIIIQDLGVLSYVRDNFPRLPLHISTQAAVTGVNGARFLKAQGAVRIVPARELNLKEIRTIKEETGLELETFIHGAMCYCYSGQCLFSSIVGGRSGNRGRCAQPCRLPYEFRLDGKNCLPKESYPLSLKDMCTIEDIPRLLEAGIDSFKIEGRMKKPEYAAGVTSIYRKYIDRWYENSDKCKEIEPEDLQKLASLYIRSEVQNGYYFRHNGPEMITLESPAYSGSDEKLLEVIRKAYLIPEKKLPISVYVYCHVGEALLITLFAPSAGESCVSLEGPIVENASRQPATEEGIREKITKMGNTLFEVTDCRIDLGENCFVPVKILNELRREVVLQLEDAILKQKKDKIKDRLIEKSAENICLSHKNTEIKGGFSVSAATFAQLEACMPFTSHMNRLYVESDLLLSKEQPKVRNLLIQMRNRKSDLQIFVALPFVIRLRDKAYIESLRDVLLTGEYDGCLLRNVEALGLFTSGIIKEIPIMLAFDAGMYAFQSQTVDLYKNYADTVTFPYELNRQEKKYMMQKCRDVNFEQVIFGRIPMMISANCLAKTVRSCWEQKQSGSKKNKGPADRTMTLVDRYKHEFPVQNVCRHCYNIIWNCLPLSLHTRLTDYGPCLKRIQFTVESAKDVGEILAFFFEDVSLQKDFPIKDYTTGHEKRGVE